MTTILPFPHPVLFSLLPIPPPTLLPPPSHLPPSFQLTVLGQQQRQSAAPRGQRSRPRGPIGPLKPEQVRLPYQLWPLVAPATSGATGSNETGHVLTSLSLASLPALQVAKLLSELDIVRRNIDIMSEIMTENEPGKESAEDFQLLEVRGHYPHFFHYSPLSACCRSSIVQYTTCRVEWLTSSSGYRMRSFLRALFRSTMN